MAADGQPTDFDAAFGASALLAWFRAARMAMAGGTLGVAIGACGRCRAPLALRADERVALACPHCAHPCGGDAVDVLVDQWPEPWAQVEGGGMSLEYRLSLTGDREGTPAGCAACGLPTPAGDQASRCPRCGATTWISRPSPDGARRVQLGVRIDGTRAGRPVHALVPVTAGEAALHRDATLGTSAEAGRSMLGLTGLGCAIALGVLLLVVIGGAMAITFAARV
jgi:DNA-directed RNA polymerase subunit RPC12/RpoP